MLNYFKAEKINDTVTAIRSRSGEIMYLVEGLEKAALIDAGAGVKGLRMLVESLTSKPLSVILTHGHMDHAMGAPEFADCPVYLNCMDWAIYEDMRPLEKRKDYLAANIGGEEPWLKDDNNFVPVTDMDFMQLEDGLKFDLGGITLEAYTLGGHTKGIMTILVPEEKVLISGDACNNATFLFDENSLSVEEYRENLINLQKRLEGRFEKVFMMHHRMEASTNLIKDAIKVCDTILAGQADDIEFHFMGNINYIAKAANEQFVRFDGGEANIIYDRNKLYK